MGKNSDILRVLCLCGDGGDSDSCAECIVQNSCGCIESIVHVQNSGGCIESIVFMCGVDGVNSDSYTESIV